MTAAAPFWYAPPMSKKVLHVLSQRPSMTGSGITLDAIVRHAAARGWEQRVIVGVPAGEEVPSVGALAADRIHALEFGGEDLPFPVPGMSDVMPYDSTRFSSMDQIDMELYLGTFGGHIERIIEDDVPDLIHSHHLWLLSAIMKDVAPDIPVVTHCHATGFRQMELCPDLAEGVVEGCARNERFAVLHDEHAAKLSEILGVPPERIRVVGAGYRDDVFSLEQAGEDRGKALVYVGKYSRAKGLPWLLDAFDILRGSVPDATLHVAGGGSGPESDDLLARMESQSGVTVHGMLDQASLASLMRRCAVCVLPSFYEGLPLALVEALACGCRLVSTDLPGIRTQLFPHLSFAMDMVPTPRLESVDEPREEDLSGFTSDLASALLKALDAPSMEPEGHAMREALDRFTWRAVFEKVERIWAELI